MNKKKLKTHLAAEKLSNNKNQKLSTWCGKSSERDEISYHFP